MAHSTFASSTFVKPHLTFVGVGPGDPSLMTLAAVEAIENANVVAYPVSKKGGRSIAASIASKWISEEKTRVPLLFPMVSETVQRKQAWQHAGKELFALVKEGKRVVFLCEGDISLFATSAYVLQEIKANHPECPISLVPGVNAISAAAAVGEWPLALQKEQLWVLPTPETADSLEEILDTAVSSERVIALMKLGKRWQWVRPLLERKGLLEGALFAQRVGFPDQQVTNALNVPSSSQPYFSLLLLRQSSSHDPL